MSFPQAVKPCPDTKHEFSATFEALPFLQESFSAACLVIFKIRYFWVVLGICSLAAVLESVHFDRERNSGVSNKSGLGDIRRHAVREGNAMGEGGLTRDGGRRHLCHRAGSGFGLPRHAPRHTGAGGAGVGCGSLVVAWVAACCLRSHSD